jgi:hypothetical protein
LKQDARNCDLKIRDTGLLLAISPLLVFCLLLTILLCVLSDFLSSAFFVRGAVKKIMAKLKLDLHEICKNGKLIEKELNRVIDQATEKRIALVEIIPGKGSGQLKKTVLRFLERPDIKKRYHRINKDSKNFGRVFVHFKH